MPKLPYDTCYGCWACKSICPKSAITMVENFEGFLYPKIEETICFECKKCEKVCPALHDHCPKNRNAEPLTWAMWNKNHKIRLNSSSGGVFSALAEQFIRRNGIVFGAAFDLKWNLKHTSAQSLSEIEPLCGSKYLQSQIENSYANAKVYLQQGKEILFTGTPCQIAGLYGFLGGDKFLSLTTCEIICHGVPSPKFFSKYLSEIKKETVDRISRINFRDKSFGWENYHLTIITEQNKKKSLSHKKDYYMRIFLNNLCLRKSCATCSYSRIPRIADITIGDYWNIKTAHPEIPNDDSGINVVLANTKKGAQAIQNISQFLEAFPSSLSKAITGNKNLVEPNREPQKRSDFFSMLEKNTTVELYKKYCPKPSLGKRLLIALKSIKLKN